MASQTSSQQKSPDILDEEYEQFATEVVDFSSQYAGERNLSYSVKNLAGASEIYPKYGDFTQACVLRTYGPWWKLAPSYPTEIQRVPSDFVSQDYIDLSFETPVIPTKIEIYETYNPGAVSRIVACISSNLDQSGNSGKKLQWMTLWSGMPKPVPRKSRIFSPPLALIPYPVMFLRLEFCSSLCDYYTELDAVKLTGKRCSQDYIKKITKILYTERDVPSLDEHQESMSGMMQWLSLGSGSSDPPEGYFSLLPVSPVQQTYVQEEHMRDVLGYMLQDLHHTHNFPRSDQFELKLWLRQTLHWNHCGQANNDWVQPLLALFCEMDYLGA